MNELESKNVPALATKRPGPIRSAIGFVLSGIPTLLVVGLLLAFAATSVASIVGFHWAKSVHKSTSPSRVIARFSVLMAYSFGLYLMSCLGLAALHLSRGSYALSAAFFVVVWADSITLCGLLAYRHFST